MNLQKAVNITPMTTGAQNMNDPTDNKQIAGFSVAPNTSGWQKTSVNGENVLVPIGWKVTEISEATKLHTGISAPKSFSNNGLPFIRVSTLSTSRSSVGGENTEEKLAGSWKTVPVGTLLAAKSGESIHQHYRNITTEKCVIVGHIVGFEARPHMVDVKYLKNSFNWRPFETDLVQGGATPSIGIGQIEKVQITLPPLPEQIRIAAVLTAQEDQIADLHAWSTLERSRLAWLTDELLSGRIRVVDRVSGTPVVVSVDEKGQAAETLAPYDLVANEDGWTEVEVNGENVQVPIGWSVSSYGEAAEFLNGDWGVAPTKENQGLICYRKADYDGSKIIHGTTRRISKRNAFVSKNDTIIEKSGGGEKNPVGAPALVVSTEPAICSNFMVCAKTKDNVDSVFFFYQYAQLYKSNTISALYQQTTGIQNLQVGDLKKIPFIAPPLPEQTRIAAVLTAQENQIADIEALITAEQHRLAWLTDELLSGRIRVVEQDAA